MERPVLAPGWALTGLGALASIAGLIESGSLLTPVLAGVALGCVLVVFGLDPVIAGSQWRGSSSWQAALGVGALYLVFGVAGVLLWAAVPSIGLLAGLLLLGYLFGRSELLALEAFGNDTHLVRPLQRALTVVLRGGIPVVVSPLAFPDRYASWVGLLYGTLPARTLTMLSTLLTADYRLALGLWFAGLTLVAIGVGFAWGGGGASWLVDGVELLLCWLYFLLVPPALALLLYVLVFYSLRRLGTLLVGRESQSGRDVEESHPGLRADALTLLKQSLPGALLLGLGVTAIWVGSDPGARTTSELLRRGLVGGTALLLAHASLLVVLDRERGLWRSSTE